MDLPTRKNIRLFEYDYSQNGAYFITICTKDRHDLLWENLGNDDQPVVGTNCVHPCNVNDVPECWRTDDDGRIECGRTQFAPTKMGEPPKLSFIGGIIDNEINKIPEKYSNVKIDKYVIMPNHIHMIVMIDEFCDGGSQTVHVEGNQNPCSGGELCSLAYEMPIINENGQPQITPTISRIMKQFKGSISKQTGYSIWQKSFYDHIIRNEKEYLEIWQYIDENPNKWQNDCFYNDM